MLELLIIKINPVKKMWKSQIINEKPNKIMVLHLGKIKDTRLW